MRSYCLLAGVLIWTFNASALAQQSIFPGLTGDELLQALQGSYTPAFVLEYGPARDTLYAKIDNVNDTVYGIYSAHGIYLPPGEEPREWLYKAGNPNGPGGIPDAINAEHSYPLSKGATNGTNGYSDLHHIFPSRLAVNEDRGSLPFGEIPDPQTEKWYYRNEEQTNIPTEHIDAFSEGTGASFEPRESVKGNIARAVFYFYTIYRQNAINADPDFFDSQRADLCQWHILDPADIAELDRSSEIAMHQAGVENPFVVDCSLAKRLYCPELEDSCSMVGTSDWHQQRRPVLSTYWSSAQMLRLFYTSINQEPVRITVRDLFGRIISRRKIDQVIIGMNQWELNVYKPLSSGIYIVDLQHDNPKHLRIQKLSLLSH